MRTIDCLRCRTPMTHFKDVKIQLGQTGWVLGDLPNLFAGAMEAAVYLCPSCGKIELYQVDNAPEDNQLPQITCPRCGKRHDIDYYRCPFCKYERDR